MALELKAQEKLCGSETCERHEKKQEGGQMTVKKNRHEI